MLETALESTRSLRPFSTLQIGMGASRTNITGADRYFLDLLRALPSAGVDANGLVVGEPDLIDDPVPSVRAFAPSGAPRMQRLREERRSVRALLPRSDLVVTHGAAHASPIIDLLGNKPHVVHFHGPWASESRAEGRGLPRYLIRRAQERITYPSGQRFIVLSRAFGDILAAENKIDWERIRIVPGGVTMERFAELPSRDEARRRLGLPTDRPIVATVRRLVPSKGIDRLIDAIASIRRDIPDVYCVVVGQGPFRNDLQRRIDEREATAHISLAGFLPDSSLKDVYRAADLFVVPTVALEGFGLATLEALACGTPSLVTPVGGLGEAVSGLAANLVLASSSAADIAQGLRNALRGDMPMPSESACIGYAKTFDWKTIAGRVADVYREVL